MPRLQLRALLEAFPPVLERSVPPLVCLAQWARTAWPTRLYLSHVLWVPIFQRPVAAVLPLACGVKQAHTQGLATPPASLALLATTALLTQSPPLPFHVLLIPIPSWKAAKT